MKNFPQVPKWWSSPYNKKFMKLDKEFISPDYLVGYDTETFYGNVLTQQIAFKKCTENNVEEKLDWINKENILHNFLQFMECSIAKKQKCTIVVFCFNAAFDLSILLWNKFSEEFLKDDFEVHFEKWRINVFCASCWFATFTHRDIVIQFIDAARFFSGSLEQVAKDFKVTPKMKHPEGLGNIKYSPKDKYFCKYAMNDAVIALEIGEIILQMHKTFDVPLAVSSANFAEKVFRRQFLKEGSRVIFPPVEARRLAELAYHGGKNGFYLETPTSIPDCYEYDFNAAYGYAMYTIPTFLDGEFKRVSTFNEKFAGIYQVSGKIASCKYGVLYDHDFNYFRFGESAKIKSFATGYEVQEALRSRELKIDSIEGYIWKPSTTENPLKEYAKYFWEKKNSTPKSDIHYQFYKLLLNSLYGKWIQRNPIGQPTLLYNVDTDECTSQDLGETAGGLYNPFIAALITGFTSARLHEAEHYFDAIESSTDSVKSRVYHEAHDNVKQFGVMQLERLYCSDCDKYTKNFRGLFLRGRLNLLMHKCGKILKCALHGFWGTREKLKEMQERKENWYVVERMPLVREGLMQRGKQMFAMNVEERSLNIDWTTLKVEKK